MNYAWVDYVIIYAVLGGVAVACGALIYIAIRDKR